MTLFSGFFIKPLLLVLIDTTRINFGVLINNVELFIDLKGLRAVNFSVMGPLPLGRSIHPWLIFLMIVPLKAIVSP
jgi:hypothetical protein